MPICVRECVIPTVTKDDIARRWNNKQHFSRSAVDKAPTCFLASVRIIFELQTRTTVIRFSYTLKILHGANYSRQTMRWSLRGVNILSAVRGEYRACR
jgi:hypothetical protein